MTCAILFLSVFAYRKEEVMKVFSYLEILTVANLVFSTGSIISYGEIFCTHTII